MDEEQAQRFASALTELCMQHGVMIWTATAAMPIMATAVTKCDAFHYEADRTEFGNAAVIRRVLAPASENEPMNFKVSPDFKQRFKMHAVRHRLRLNQLLVAMCESWEREHGETPD